MASNSYYWFVLQEWFTVFIRVRSNPGWVWTDLYRVNWADSRPWLENGGQTLNEMLFVS